VNEQAQVSLLLAGPGVIATLVFAPLVIALFYSAKFDAAVGILRWICLGAALQVITWPMGFIVVAKDRPKLFIVCELAYTGFYLGLAWICIEYWGLDGAGVAFFGSYAFHALLIYPIVARLTGFRWSAANQRTSLAYLAAIGMVFSCFYMLPFWLAITVGILTLLLNTAYSVRVLSRLVPWDRLPRPLKLLLVLFRLSPPGSHE
jgi:enterobacterial common antigen flippase